MYPSVCPPSIHSHDIHELIVLTHTTGIDKDLVKAKRFQELYEFFKATNMLDDTEFVSIGTRCLMDYKAELCEKALNPEDTEPLSIISKFNDEDIRWFKSSSTFDFTLWSTNEAMRVHPFLRDEVVKHLNLLRGVELETPEVKSTEPIHSKPKLGPPTWLLDFVQDKLIRLYGDLRYCTSTLHSTGETLNVFCYNALYIKFANNGGLNRYTPERISYYFFVKTMTKWCCIKAQPCKKYKIPSPDGSINKVQCFHLLSRSDLIQFWCECTGLKYDPDYGDCSKCLESAYIRTVNGEHRVCEKCAKTFDQRKITRRVIYTK